MCVVWGEKGGRREREREKSGEREMWYGGESEESDRDRRWQRTEREIEKKKRVGKPDAVMIFYDSFMACRSFRREFFVSYYFEKCFVFSSFVHSTEVLERGIVWGQRQTALRLLWRK